MRRKTKQAVSILLVGLMVVGPTPMAFGRGGGRGGGGFGGGGARMGGGGGGRPGGGMSRPSPSVGRSPSFSRPSPGPSRPAGGVSRPSIGGPSVGARPGGGGPGGMPSPGLTPGSRPGSVDFARPGARPSTPGLTPGTRPSIGSGPGISQLPSSPRPGGPGAGGPGAGGIGNRPGIGQGPGISQLPTAPRPGAGGPGIGEPGGLGLGGRPGIGQGPGISQLPSNRPGGGALAGAGIGAGIGAGAALLPGLGNRPGGDRPGLGERPSQRPDRTPGERRDNLQDRLASRNDNRQDRLDNRDQRREDWQNNRDDIREDWQDRYEDFYDRHEGWHHGCWHGNYGDWWHHMWSEHTALMAFGTTMWGINAAAWGFGYWGYENPYYTESYPISEGVYIDYSQPIAIDTGYTSASQAAAAPPAASASASGMTDFDAARQAFYINDYAGALAFTNKALAALPNDPIIHEFRSLILFAQGKYKEAAAGLYSVLSVGPGWDWTTLSSLYPNVDVYTKQLRALEAFVKQQPQASEGRFVLAYHYLTCGSKDHAARQLQEIYKQRPQDMLVKQLLLMTGGPEAIGAAPPTVATEPSAAPAIPASDVVGNWTASGQNMARFALELARDGSFSWTFTQKDKPQTVKGVYALDGNVLAMEPETGGVMLAELTPPRGGSFEFHVLGAPPGDPGLKFTSKN